MKPVTFPIKLQMKRAEVGDLQQALSFLGLTIAEDEKGNQRFGASTRAAVRQFQLDHKLPETGEVDEATAKAINKELADRGVLDVEPGPGGDLPGPNPPPADPDISNLYAVAGRVLRAAGPPVGRAVVRAWHKNLRSEVPLGEPAVSDDLGRYSIRYMRPDHLKQVDLVVRATDPDPDGQGEIARSRLICGAKKKELVDLIAGSAEYRGYSEYERIATAVEPHLDGVAVQELTVADVELLECKTHENPIHVAYLAIANQYTWTEIPAPVFYGCFRMGLPTSLVALVSQHPRDLRRAILDATSANVIPESHQDKLQEILRRFKEIAAKLALEVPDGRENISLAPLLSTAGLTPAQQGVLLTRYTLHTESIEEFWASLKKDPELGKPELVEELQFTLQLGTLAGGYVPLVRKLQERRKKDQIRSVQDLAALQHEDWLALIGGSGTPPGIPGETDAQRSENYARILGQTIEVAFPTQSIVAGLKRRNSSPDLLRFFANSASFTFEANIDRYLRENGGSVLDGINDPARTITELKRLQRVYKISPPTGRFSAMSALLDSGLDSAHAITGMGQSLLTKSLSGLLGGQSVAMQIYANAAQSSARALSTFGRYSLALSVGTPAVIRNLTAQGTGIPDWESLFGSLSFCECEHCRSVYSPAAYFVDLLQFVKQQPAVRIVAGVVTYPTITLADGSTRQKNALDVLFERRSDLGEIELSCQNTNTLMPYIDLSNEILENAVARQTATYQTTWTAAELSANPEHQNEVAYNWLAVQVYPRLLPFPLWLHEARTYLGHLGVSLVELMEVLHRPGRTGIELVELELQIAVESLGLSLAAARIITNTLQPARPLWAFWGWPVKPTNWPDVLFDLPTFLERAEIEYATLEALCKIEFINPDKKLAVSFATPCKIEAATIDNLTEPVLDKIHRFLRLQQAIGWVIAELDAAITAMQAADLTPVFLAQLSRIQRLKTALNRPVLEMLSWWSRMSTVVDESDPEDRSLYNQLFLNNTVLSPVDEAFQLNSARSDLENAGTAPLGEHKPAILAALSITEAELVLILSATGKTESDGLTLALLSELYRHASLVKALGLATTDFLSLRKLTGIDPFESPKATLDFSAEVVSVNRSQFSVATLDYLLRHVYTDTGGLAPTASSITLVLDSIKTGLQAIAAENAFTADPTGEMTRGRLSLVVPAEELGKAVAIIEGTSTLSLAEQETFIDEHFAIFVADTTVTKTLLMGPIDPNYAAQQKQSRYEHILQPLVSYLRYTLNTQLVVQTMADALGLETAVSEALLTEYVTAPNDSSKKAIDILIGLDLVSMVYTPAELDTYRLLHKIATVLTTLKVTAAELVWVFEKGPSLGWLNLNHLPLVIPSDTQASNLYAAWKRLFALYSFRDTYPAAGDVTVFRVLDLVDSGSDRDTVLSTLTSLTGWDTIDVDYLTGANGFNLAYPEDYSDERYLVHLQAAFGLLTRLGVSAEAAKGWSVSDNPGHMKTIATAIKSTVKAKYDNDTWLTVAEPLKNRLREQQRSALVAHLVARMAGIDAAGGLFEHYLIDVEMNSCMKTSRIKQAISSVQLFIQRSLMNLEPNVEIDALSAAQWEWMKNYRVWEANRKIFLYPENWILPELRDDKSPFFKELENELLQNEINQATAEAALSNYLYKLDQVANLDVRALYHETEYGAFPVDVLHVFGRTRSNPHVYYYRRYVDASYWTPWETVPCDIQGDHLLPVAWNRRLYLIWPAFKEVSDEQGTRWEIQLAWSEHQNGHWSAKRVTEAALEIPIDDLSDEIVTTVTTRPSGPVREISAAVKTGLDRQVMGIGQTKDGDPVYPDIDTDEIEIDEPENEGTTAVPADSGTEAESSSRLVLDTRGFVFKSEITTEDELLVTCFLYTTTNSKFRQQVGTFRFSGCNGRVYPELALEGGESYVENVPNYCYAIGMQFAEAATGAGDPLFIRFDGSSTEASGDTVLEKTRDGFSLAVSHQYEEFTAQDHFFYQDDAAAYLVDPQVIPTLDRAVEGLQYEDTLSFDLSSSFGIGVKMADRLPSLAATPSFSYELGTLTKPGTRTYSFFNAYHPHVCAFIKTLNQEGIDGLMQRSIQLSGEGEDAFVSEYEPVAGTVNLEYPENSVDFTESGAYSVYNWELFFHVPLLIAARLSQNQRFDEARRWFHYIFNPAARADSAAIIGPERYWNFLPFYKENAPETIDELLLALNAGDEELEAQVAAWRETPFNPHLIARMRPVAYMKTVVMKYLDNLIAWGDSLFRQDTIESINEATQLYVLAADILGSPPQSLPPDRLEDAETYNSLADKLDEFSNALVQIENQEPPIKTRPFDPFGGPITLPPILFRRPFPVPPPNVETLYFCVPKNDELSAYWDTVADRLFKIRNCMNIEGVVRQLALFEPPINPALLVQAAAAGIDISSVLSDLYAPLPHYRFQIMLQKTMEFCADVRSLGAGLLAALEKQDGEALALLRASVEKQILDAAHQVREKQVDEAQRSLEGIEQSKAVLENRKEYYATLITGGQNPHEVDHLARLEDANRVQKNAQLEEQLATVLYAVPQFVVAFPPKTESQYGGLHLGQAGQAAARLHGIRAIDHSYQANRASILGGYARREAEWKFQLESVTKELQQIDKQIAAAQIRLAVAEAELANHNKQIEHAQETYDFMVNKYTNDQLYSWMISQISGIYFQGYQMAYDLAKRAEKAYQHELGVTTSSFITFGYWDSLKKGLLSGEKLNYDLRRMEMSYLDQNKREYEITKHVSLALLNPEALLRLTTEGECSFAIPEAVFDLECPGHYLRRIKAVSMTIPCVTGPYTSLNCRLTLTADKIRKETSTTGGYAHTGPEDARFQQNYIAQSIATSSGQNDSGVFELNFRDERYLPLEGRGVISDWSLELTSAVPTFDWSTITDVVLHLQYTARDGGDLLREAAIGTSEDLDGGLGGRLSLQRGFSAKHEFPTEWSSFLHPAQSATEAVLKLDLSEKRFPYFARNLGVKITELQLVALLKDPTSWSNIVTVEGGGSSSDVTLASLSEVYDGHPSGTVIYQKAADPGEWTVKAATGALGAPSEWLDDFVVIATYKVTVPT